MKVALVHDWLTGMRGGERCLDAFLDLYPSADIFTLIHVHGATTEKIDARVKVTSWLNKLPGIKYWYRWCLPAYPFAVRGFDFTGYDLIISLSHASAKNIRVPKNVPHVCYCFTPMRYIWDQAEAYFGHRGTKILSPILWWLRNWDRKGADGVSKFVAISRFVAARIRLFYKRRAEVIFPMLERSWFESKLPIGKGDAFLYAGALVPYKRPDLAVLACRNLDLPLWVVGDGPELEKLRIQAGPKTVFLGRVSDLELSQLYQKCRALIFPSIEDFGLVPLECLASGRPVLALYAGAARESLACHKYWQGHPAPDNCTGLYFKPLKTNQLASLEECIYYFIEREQEFSSDKAAQTCRNHALRFSKDNFFRAWSASLPGAKAQSGQEYEIDSDSGREPVLLASN